MSMLRLQMSQGFYCKPFVTPSEKVVKAMIAKPILKRKDKSDEMVT